MNQIVLRRIIPQHIFALEFWWKGVSPVGMVMLGVKDTGEKVPLNLTTAGAESADGLQMLLEDLAARAFDIRTRHVSPR